jgi:hypothetical protein
MKCNFTAHKVGGGREGVVHFINKIQRGSQKFLLKDTLNLYQWLSLNRSARTRVYAGKWTSMVYHLQMAKFWSTLGPRTNLIDRKCCIFNGEKDYIFALWSKT